MKDHDKPSLSDTEKPVVKKLLQDGWRNQDIQALVNLNRISTINFARIAEVKKNDQIVPASDSETEFYIKFRNSFDPVTKLNHYDDEKLIRAREAMLLAVNVFNSPTLLFKAEMFSMLANVAWTYMLHEYYSNKGVETVNKAGYGLLLSQILERHDCPLTKETIANLKATKEIRDAVEHTFFHRSDQKFLSIFQANCLNFDRAICQLFGEKLSLKNELSFSLQFAKLDFDQLSELSKFDVPANIKALDAKLQKEFGQFNDSIEYQFSVNFELVSSTKAAANINFVNDPNALKGPTKNVLVKKVAADDEWPHKAGVAAAKIAKLSKKKFTVNNHTSAWRHFDARPPTKAKQPQNTNKKFCVYHPAHKDYTYSDAWVEMVADFIGDEDQFANLKKK